METSLYKVALRFEGMKEKIGPKSNPFIQWCYSLCGLPDSTGDETPWCSAFMNGICYGLGLPRSGSAAARSWLAVGAPVDKDGALIGQDIVILQRGKGTQPGPEVLKAPGHVGVFAGYDDGKRVKVLGGNQGDMVCVKSFPMESVLGIRRLS